MLLGIDHLIIACADPDAAANQIEAALGLNATGGGRHDAHGTFNRLIWLGDSYIELMGVFDATLAADSWWGAHILGRVASEPAGYAGLALATDDLAADADRLHDQGSSISGPVVGERARPDGDVVPWRIGRLPEPDPELGLVFLIEHDTSAAEWRPADRIARADQTHPLGTPGRLSRAVLPVADAGAATLRLLRELGLQFRPSLAGGRARDSSVGAQIVRVVLATAGTPPEIGIRAGRNRQQAELLGCRWVIEAV